MEPELHFQELVRLLLRRWRLIATAAATGAILAIAGSIVIPPEYTAKAEVIFQPQRAYPGIDPAPLGAAAAEVDFQTHIAALKSRSYLKRVLDDLSKNPAFRPATTAPSAEAHRLDVFARHVKIYQEGESHIIAVTFRSTNPIWAAQAANRLAGLYIETQIERKRAQESRNLAWLTKRLQQARAALEQPQLARTAVPAERVYDILLKHQTQLAAQQGMAASDLRILSPASPPDRPSSLSPLLLVMPAIVLFGLGGSLLAVVIERLGARLYSAQEVTDKLGLRCIGCVPLAACNGKARPHHQLLENPRAAYTEAIRSLAVPLLMTAATANASRVTMISSSVPNEGKTTLAVSIGTYIALIGRRVLLIDLDFRRPAVGRELGGEAGMDVLDALYLEDLGSGVIQHARDLYLDYLPIRRTPGDPLLPFLGEEMPRLLRQVRDHYDYVIVDGPPLLAAAEARLLATIVDNMILAVKWGSTRCDVAQDASRILHDLRDFKESHCEVLGAVLTQVNLKKHVPYLYPGAEARGSLIQLVPAVWTRPDETVNLNTGDSLSLEGFEAVSDAVERSAAGAAVHRHDGVGDG